MSGASEDQAGVPSLFARWLSRKRQSLGLTLDDLAERMGGGCDPATIKAWEAGSLRPSRHMAERLARLFDVPAAERLAFVLFAISDLDSGDPGSYPSPEPAGDPEIDPAAPWRVKANPPSNLPVQLTTFVGRESEIEGVAGLVRYPGVRLLTLLGPPGIGKTRFSLEVARTLHEGGYYEDGVFAVLLAAITDPAGIAPAIASALGVKEAAGGSPHQALTDFLRDKRLLLVLDNMEQIPDAGEVVTALLTAAPDVQIVTTSRSALRVYGEQVWRVPPLPVPESDKDLSAESLSRSEAATLFVQRARSVQPHFVVDDSVAPVIAEICRRLDGLPLAIELAAARTNVLSPQALLTRLQGAESAGEGHEGRLSTLTGGPQNLSPRQRTLRGAIEWSYNLLDDPERLAYRRLSVCVGGFGLDTAEAILNSHFAPHNSLDLISSLVDKSLLKQEEGPDKEARFAMLETIREYGLERLSESDEENEVRRAHAQAMLVLTEQAEPHMTTGGRDPWLRKLDADLDNIRAALNWSLSESGDVQLGLCLAGSLGWYWYFRTYISEGRNWLDYVLARADRSQRTRALAKALCSAGRLAQQYSQDLVALPLLEESVSIWREQNDVRNLAYALILLGLIGATQSNHAYFTVGGEAITLFRQTGDRWGLAHALQIAGDTTWWRKQINESLECYRESLALYKELGDLPNVAYELGQLGFVTITLGDHSSARTYFDEALKIEGKLGNRWNRATLLRGLGNVAHLEGDYREAEAAYAESYDLYREFGDRGRMSALARCLGLLAFRQEQYDRALALFREALDVLREIGSDMGTRWTLMAMAGLAVACGQAELAATLLAAVTPRQEVSLETMPKVDFLNYEQCLSSLHAKLDDKKLEMLSAQGRGMTLEQAVAASYGLKLPEKKGKDAATAGEQGLTVSLDRGVYPSGLSKREVELLRLLATGLSNAQIAARLFLSANTVRAHLYSIYSKINVQSRTAAAHFAVEHRLI